MDIESIHRSTLPRTKGKREKLLEKFRTLAAKAMNKKTSIIFDVDNLRCKEEEPDYRLEKRRLIDLHELEDAVASYIEREGLIQAQYSRRTSGDEVREYFKRITPYEKESIQRFIRDQNLRLAHKETLRKTQVSMRKFFSVDVGENWLDILQNQPGGIPTLGEELVRQLQENESGLNKNQLLLKTKVLILNGVLNLRLKIPAAAKKWKVPERTIRRTLADLRSGSLQRKIVTSSEARQGRPRVVSEQVILFAENYARAQHGEVTIAEIRSALIDRFELRLVPSVSSLRKYLRIINLKWKRRRYVPRGRNTLENKEVRSWFMCKLIEAYLRRKHIVCVDETGVGRFGVRRFHYEKKGEFWGRTQGANKFANLTCVFAVDDGGVVQTMYSDQGCDGIMFYAFVRQLIAVTSG